MAKRPAIKTQTTTSVLFSALSGSESSVSSKLLLALLLENEALIAMDVETTLIGAGFKVSSLMSCEDAHLWLDRHRPDVAIVEINLSDGPCTDIALRLVRARIPFVVHSGAQSTNYYDTPFAQGIWIGKPALPSQLAAAAQMAASYPRAEEPQLEVL